MAHFAQLDENNIVLQVLVVGNEDINDLPFPESESLGISFLQNIFPGDRWVQTSYNSNFRVRYAAPGDTFITNTSTQPYGGFVPPKMYQSWIWDEITFAWVAPVPYPVDSTQTYEWSEERQNWVTAKQPPVPVTVIG